MCCNPYDVVSDLISLELPCLSLIISEVNNQNVYNILFHEGPNRLQLLRGILYLIDNNVGLYFEKLKAEKLVEELAVMYISAGLIKREENSFIAGNLDVENQCKIWSRIISSVKSLLRVELSSDLSELYEKNVKMLQSIIHNPSTKKVFTYNKKICCKSDEYSTGEERDILLQLEQIDKDIKDLEEKMVNLHDDDEESDKKTTVSLKDVNRNESDMERLIHEWSKSLQNLIKICCEKQNRHFNLSSGYDSFGLDSVSATTSLNLEDSDCLDSTNAILSLYSTCKNIHQFISCLKKIKLEADKIISSVEEKDSVKQFEPVLSFIKTLRH